MGESLPTFDEQKAWALRQIARVRALIGPDNARISDERIARELDDHIPEAAALILRMEEGLS